MKKQKQLIILVTYINVDRQTRDEVINGIKGYNNTIQEYFSDESLKETNTLVKHIILPINDDRPTHIDCIFPKSEDLSEDLLNKIHECEEILKKY